MRKTGFCFAFFLLLILSSGCNVTNNADSRTGFSVGKIQFGISESYQKNNVPSVPQMFLNLKTTHIYGCMNSQIDNITSVKNGTVDVWILGVSIPDLCQYYLNPATANISLNLSNGNYKLVLHSTNFGGEYNMSITDTYNLSVTDNSISIGQSSYPNTEPLYRLYWLYRPNSFVYMFGTTRDTTVYNDFLDTLKSKIDLKEFAIPDSGKILYPTTIVGNYNNMPAKYFYYKSETDFDKIGNIMKEYKATHPPNKTGYVISVVNWMDKSFSSWLL